MTDPLQCYREIWLVDFEFTALDGNRPTPICMVALEYRSGRTLRVWADELARLTCPPFSLGAENLYVAYYASAEFGCHLALDWPMPRRVLDLYVEHRNATNGRGTVAGNGLLGAMTTYGLDCIESAEKDEMRQLAMRGGPFSDRERAALLDYCESDVVALRKLLPAMLPTIDLPRAVLRGRYMKAAARMEWVGVPIDVETLAELRDGWEGIKNALIREVDQDFGVYVPTGTDTNPTSPRGQLIHETALEWEVDPHLLDGAATEAWREQRDAHRELATALKVARKTTGLTPAKIARAENAGEDHSSWLALDVHARELAAEYPVLGIGHNADHAARLWALLRDTPAQAPRRDDSGIIQDAADRLSRDGASIYTGPLSFSAAKFAEWLTERGIPWPRTTTGQLQLNDQCFRDQAKAYPEVTPLRELRHALGEMRLESLQVGEDGRNRCMLSAFASKTGRNQPSNVRSIFGPATWLRSLILPEPGMALAYCDYSQQEFGIVAALSGDTAMKEAYSSGDPYLTFAIQAGAAPAAATKESHPAERSAFKVAALAVLYGMGVRSLAIKLGGSEGRARELLGLHRRTYPTFWRWSQAAIDRATLWGKLQTVFGWTVHAGEGVNPRSMANFPAQANGAEMLRLACCLMTERGVRVAAPIHDAVLIEAPVDDIEDVVLSAQSAMREASKVVLAGFPLRSDAEIVRYPDRYMDPRGVRMWGVVTELLAQRVEVLF